MGDRSRSVDDHFAGNGGLSLRRVSAIRKILSFQARYNDTAPEDEWFGERLYITPGLKVASGLENALAVENVYKERPMGFHVQEMGENLPSEVWGSYERRKEILEYCPELYTVLNAKLDRERCPGDSLDGGKWPAFATALVLWNSCRIVLANPCATVIHPTPEEEAMERMRLEAEAEARKNAMEEAAKKIQEANRQKEEEEAKKKEEEEAKKKEEEEAKKKEEAMKAQEQQEPAATGQPAWATVKLDQPTAKPVPVYDTQSDTPGTTNDGEDETGIRGSGNIDEVTKESQDGSSETSKDRESTGENTGGEDDKTSEDAEGSPEQKDTTVDSFLSNPDGGV